MRIYTQKDIGHNVLAGARIAVLGYGNQGHAHALNLRDSGADVVIGARPGGSGWSRAEADGFAPREIAEAVAGSEHVAIMLPDETQGTVFAGEIADRLSPGATLYFSHGFSIAFDVIAPPLGHDVILVAPKGQGHFLRRQFAEGKSLPCLVAVGRDESGEAWAKALSYADMIGCLATGAIETTFEEEAVTDLFGEQSVLCGGVPALVKAAFETLVESGYAPEVAYIECLHELKIITDLMYRRGVVGMRERISRTAAWGSYTVEDDVVSGEVRSALKNILKNIQSGQFAREWREESESGQKTLKRHIEKESSHPIERAGERVRALMPYLKEEDS